MYYLLLLVGEQVLFYIYYISICLKHTYDTYYTINIYNILYLPPLLNYGVCPFK